MRSDEGVYKYVNKEQPVVEFIVLIVRFVVLGRSFPALAYEALTLLALLSADVHGVLMAKSSNNARTCSILVAEDLGQTHTGIGTFIHVYHSSLSYSVSWRF